MADPIEAAPVSSRTTARIRTKPTWRAATPTVRTVGLWALAFAGVGLIAIFALIARDGFTARSMLWLVGLNVLAFPVWVALPIAGVRDRRRRQRELEDPNFRACLRCGYDLGALPDETPNPRCPECAEPYDPHTNRATWRKALRLPP